jgi:hypothetical protein
VELLEKKTRCLPTSSHPSLSQSISEQVKLLEKEKKELLFSSTKEKESLKFKLISLEKSLFMTESKCVQLGNRLIEIEKDREDLLTRRKEEEGREQYRKEEEAQLSSLLLQEKDLLCEQLVELKKEVEVCQREQEEWRKAESDWKKAIEEMK